MATVAATATKQEKEKWLLRPFEWALSAVLYPFVFGSVFWFEGKLDGYALAGGLVIALGIASAFMVWGFHRVQNAIRGR